MLFRFQGFDLDDDVFSLRKGDVDVTLRPQALEVLTYLLVNRARLVTKRELLDAIWRGAAVSDNTLLQAIAAIRRALEDDDEAPRIIQTVRGRGYRFIATVEPAEETRARATNEPLLVGRDDALKRLDELLDASTASKLGLALLSGGAGLGKTRLLGELARRARSRGFEVLGASCRANDGAPDLWPWVQALRSHRDDSAVGQDAIALAGELADGNDSNDGGQFRAFDRVVQALTRASKQRPLLVWIDDAHEADVPSLLLLKLVATSLRSARIALALAYRDGNLPSRSPFARTLGALAREESTRSIPLQSFTRDDVARLASERLGSPASVDRLMEKSDGNPLLVTQMLHAIERQQGGSTSALLALGEMREAVALQLEEISASTLAILSAACVLGAEVTLGQLAAVSGQPASALLEPIEEALRARVLARSPGGLRFVHALVRDVLYRKLTIAERVKMHRAAGIAAFDGDRFELAIDAFERALHGLDRLRDAPEDTGDAKARCTALRALLDA